MIGPCIRSEVLKPIPIKDNTLLVIIWINVLSIQIPRNTINFELYKVDYQLFTVTIDGHIFEAANLQTTVSLQIELG